ncbi:MAG: sugar transferase [Minisyncoccia bacterium]
MSFAEKIRKIILVIGDIICFYFSLYLMAIIRNLSADYLIIHLKLFSIIFLVWIFIFYIGHFYELINFRERKKIISSLTKLQIINVVLAIIIFYLYPIITPKTNLILIIVFSSVFVLVWRLVFYSVFSRHLVYKTLLIGESEEIKEIKKHLEESPQLGYKLITHIEKIDGIKKEDVERMFEKDGIKVIVVDNLSSQKELKDVLLKMMFKKVEIYDTADFYSLIFKCVPLNFVDENWFLDYFNLYHQKINLFIKDVCDFILALIFLVVSLPFWPLIILAIKIDSAGPIFYSSWRVGQNGKLFKIYKFRSMYQNVSNSSRWSKENDERITRVGKFLRKTHLDELPQLVNILKGEMSFVGPRPIEKELFDLCVKEKPIYYLRNLIKPGLAGWAQLNYRYAACLEDELKKFEYDLYYIRNQSFWFDLAIIMRTIKLIFNW